MGAPPNDGDTGIGVAGWVDTSAALPPNSVCVGYVVDAFGVQQAGDERQPGGATHEEEASQLVGTQATVLDHRIGLEHRAAQQRSGDPFQLLAGEVDRLVSTGYGDRRDGCPDSADERLGFASRIASMRLRASLALIVQRGAELSSAQGYGGGTDGSTHRQVCLRCRND